MSKLRIIAAVGLTATFLLPVLGFVSSQFPARSGETAAQETVTPNIPGRSARHLGMAHEAGDCPANMRIGGEGCLLFVAAGTQAISTPIQVADTGHQLRVGEMIAPGEFHPINRPGLYGLAPAPHGQGFGIGEGKLFRYDAQSMQVMSVIRQIDRVLD